MKRKYILKLLLALTLTFSAQLGYSQWQVFNQYFEPLPSDTDKIKVLIDSVSAKTWQVGKPNKIKFNAANTIPNALISDTANVYDTSLNSSVIFSIGDLWNVFANYYAIRWTQKLDLEVGKDFVEVLVSVDSGLTWQDAFKPSWNGFIYSFYGFNQANEFVNPKTMNGAFSGTDSVWRDMWLCLNLNNSSSIFIEKLMVKFVLTSDTVQSNQEGIIIDNVIVSPSFLHTVTTETKTKNSIVVFPTESSGIFNVETTYDGVNNSISAIEVYNINAELLESYKPNRKRVTLDLSKYPDGNYFLKSKTAHKNKTHKVFIKR